jgi:hypothetical protein
MRLLVQSILVGWLALASPLYLQGKVIATANWTQLSERSPFGVKPKKIVMEQAPVIKPVVPITIEFRGVAVTDERTYCILFDKAKNRGYSVPVGDKSAEYYIKQYDERTQSITIETPNGFVELELVDSSQSSSSGSDRAFDSFGGNSYSNDYDDPFSGPLDSGNGYDGGFWGDPYDDEGSYD